MYIGNSGFWEGVFTQIPGARIGGDFENPRGHGVLPKGIFKITGRTKGIWLKIQDQKPDFCKYIFFSFSVWYTGTAAVVCDASTFTSHAVCIYFFLSFGNKSKIAYILFSNIKQEEKMLSILTKHCELKYFNKSKPFLTDTIPPSQHNFLSFLLKKEIL